MRNYFLIFFCLLLTSFRLFSQNNQIDSLQNLLQTEKSDTSRVNILNQLAQKLPAADKEKAIQFTDEAIELAQKSNFLKGLAPAFKQKAIFYSHKGEMDKASEYFQKSLDVYEKIGDKKGAGRAYMNLGIINKSKGDSKKALELYNTAVRICDSIKDNEGVGLAYINIGNIYNSQGNYTAALEYLLKALKISEELKKEEDIAKIYNNIGTIYRAQIKYQEATVHYDKALEIYKKLDNKKGLADVLNNKGAIFYEQKNYAKALENFEECLKLNKELGSKSNIALSLFNIGDVNNKMGNFENAYNCFMQSLKIREEIKDKKGIASNYNGIGEYYYNKNDYQNSIKYLQLAYNIGSETGIINVQSQAAEILSKAFSKTRNFQKAYEFHFIYKHLYDSIFRSENEKNITRLSMQYEFDKEKEAESARQREEKLKYENEIKQQRTVSFFLTGVVFLVLLLAFFVYRSYRIKIKANNALKLKNAEIMQQKEEIEAQRDEIEKQKDEIEKQRDEIEIKNVELGNQRDIAVKQRDEIHKQKNEITDSIKYAQRIQSAVLPSRQLLMNAISDYFILFKPKDIVSGDFYWLMQKHEYIVFAAADCTGHGVPGAFMSMLGITLLNEIVGKTDDLVAGSILENLRTSVMNSLHQTGKSDEAKDGMDIALGVININDYTLQCAGAYNPVLLVRKKNTDYKFPEDIGELFENNTDYDLLDIKGDRQPIGIHAVKVLKPFRNKVLKLQKNDTLYLLSDGYIDQFSEKTNQKFKMKNFKETVLKIQHENMQNQKAELENVLHNWQGNLGQLDDILVMGFRI